MQFQTPLTTMLHALTTLATPRGFLASVQGRECQSRLTEAGVVLTMLFDVVGVLMNSNHALIPHAPVMQRLVHDMPSVAEVCGEEIGGFEGGTVGVCVALIRVLV